MIVGTPPFKTASRSDVHYRLFLDNNEAFWKLFESRGLSAELVDLINGLLVNISAHRLSFEAIHYHPWFCQRSVDMDLVNEEIRRMFI